jgi:hypothetical protein
LGQSGGVPYQRGRKKRNSQFETTASDHGGPKKNLKKIAVI